MSTNVSAVSAGGCKRIEWGERSSIINYKKIYCYNDDLCKGALPELFTTYKTVLPTLGGYINENGKLNLVRFEKFMAELSKESHIYIHITKKNFG